MIYRPKTKKLNMKKLNLLLGLFFGIVILTCSSDESRPAPLAQASTIVSIPVRAKMLELATGKKQLATIK